MLGMTERQLRHCRHTFVAFAFTAVAEMMMPCTFTRRDTCSDCRGEEKQNIIKRSMMTLTIRDMRGMSVP